jgi:hypothetical protein
MKIVINTCHGGFSLSPKAIEMLAKKQNKECYFFNRKYENGKTEYTEVEGYPTSFFWSAFSIKNPTDGTEYKYCLDIRPKDRTDSLLIQVVEELREESSGAFAKLKIVEVPDDVQWHIAEYDGWEWVAENHRKWE